MPVSRAGCHSRFDQDLLKVQIWGWACRSTSLAGRGLRAESEQALDLGDFGQIAARFIMSKQSLY